MGTLIGELLSIGSFAAISALIALGLGITFRLMGVINLAHGELLMIGAYASVFVGRLGVPWIVMVLGGVLAAAVVGALSEVLLVRWLYRSPELSLLGTYGLSIIFVQSVQLFIGNEYLYSVNPFQGSISVFGVGYPVYRLLLIALCAIVFTVVLLSLNATQLGTRIRAVAMDGRLAETLGVRSMRLNFLVFTASAAIAGFAGALVGPLGNVRPGMGIDYLFTAFIIVIIAGKNLVRLLAAAVVVSTVQNVMTFAINPVIAQLAVLAVALLVLIGNRQKTAAVAA